MAVIRNLVVKIAADISSLSKGLEDAQKKIKKVSATLTSTGAKLTASLTAPLVALGTASIKVSEKFEQSMANAASVAGASGEDFERMTKLAREMGSKTVFSASDAADALYYMASAGYKVDQMADSIEATLNLASATQSDLAFTTDTVIATLNQFGLEANQAERVTNVFAAAIGNSMASMDKLSNSMGYVGPVAHSLGYSIEETTAALSVLYNAGYDGSTAGTALRQSMVALMNPSGAALEVFKELGLTYDEVNPATNKFADIIDKLGQAGMDTSQAMKVFGARAGPGMLALLSAGGDAVRDMTDSITGTNKATEMATTQLDTLQGQSKILRSELEEIAIMFGDVLIPVLREFITKYISPLTAKFMGLSMGTRKTIVTIALLAAAIGPLLMVVGKLVGSLGPLLKIGKLLLSKTTLIIAGVTAVVGVLVYFYKTNEDVRDVIDKVWDSIKNIIVGVCDTIKSWWNKNGEKIKKSVIAVLKALLESFSYVFGRIKEIVMKVMPIIKTIVIDVVRAIKDFWEKYGEQIVAVVKTIFTTMHQIIKSAFDIICNAVLRFVEYVSPLWERIKALFASLWDVVCELVETLKPLFEVLGGMVATLLAVVMGVVDGIIAALGPFLDAVIDVANGIIEIIRFICALIKGDWSDAWAHLQNIVGSVWDAIKNIFLGIWEFLKGFGEGFVEFFKGIGVNILGIFKNVWEGISGFFSNIWSGIKSTYSSVWDTITGLFSNVGKYFSNLFKDAFNWGKNLISNIGDGIKKGWNWVVDGVKSVGQSIKDFLGFGSPTKKGPGHTADEWIPNLLEMMEQGLYSGTPQIERAAMQVASSLNIKGGVNRSMVGAGTSPFGDMVNGLLQGMSTIAMPNSDSKQNIVLEIDGQQFARLVMPKLNKEYKRNGIILREV